ncbi:uncharacterized protein LOC143264943 [Megachile rotundata]|uniref:uncharacterized protein LOC143264943 n=1 Tax=Megachile rotundata TaxID=143995 RepID=UPI003FD4B5F0
MQQCRYVGTRGHRMDNRRDGLNNVRFQDFLGPLSRYEKPSDLLRDLRGASKHLHTVTNPNRNESQGSTTYNRQGPRCYACKQTGHTARNCNGQRITAKCFKCGEEGHLAHMCPKQGQQSSTITTTVPSTITRSQVLHVAGDTHQKYFKTATVNGTQVQCYVDMGSSVVTLRQDVARELGFTYYETVLRSLIGYDQGRVQPVGIMTAEVSLDGVAVKTEVHIVPSGSQVVALLVGHPYTEHPNVVVINKAGELKILAREDHGIPKIEATKSQRATLCASTKQVIPDLYLGHITVFTDTPNRNPYVKGGLRSEGPTVPRCVVDTDEGGETVLPILNVTGRQLTFNPGDVVARAETCEEDTATREVNDEPILKEQLDTDLEGEDEEELLRTLNDNKDLVAWNISQLGRTPRPLTDLTKRGILFTRGTAQRESFETLKAALVSKPLLCIYDPRAETEVHTDACTQGVGAVLLQKHVDGKWHPVSYYSRKTTPEEARYHSYELKALAIVSALEKFRVYLIGIRFTIKTDCNSLKLLADKRDLNPRIGRWFIRLSEYNYNIEHHSADHNRVADALSRHPVDGDGEVDAVGLPVLGIKVTTDWVAAMQRGDTEILEIRNKLEAGDRETHERFTMYNARVYRVKNGKWRL